jgi:hypothetical protein
VTCSFTVTLLELLEEAITIIAMIARTIMNITNSSWVVSRDIPNIAATVVVAVFVAVVVSVTDVTDVLLLARSVANALLAKNTNGEKASNMLLNAALARRFLGQASR